MSHAMQIATDRSPGETKPMLPLGNRLLMYSRPFGPAYFETLPENNGTCLNLLSDSAPAFMHRKWSMIRTVQVSQARAPAIVRALMEEPMEVHEDVAPFTCS